MSVNSSAGAKLYIGAAAATITLSGFEAVTFVEVGEIESIGEFGDEAASVTFTALGDRRTRKLKGSFDAGTLALSLGEDITDAGQSDLREALASDDDYAIKITQADQITPSTGNPTTRYFNGKVMSFKTNVGAVDNVIRATVNIGINSAVVTDPAS